MKSTRRGFLETVRATAITAAISHKAIETSPGSKTKFYVAALTPCDSKLRFDEGLYKEMLSYFKQKGADGVVVLGTTGEFPSFSTLERKKIAETALKHRAGLSIIVQCGAANIIETIELATHAASNGADELLCIPPFFYKDPPLAGLTRYYAQLLEAVRIPVNLYHIPSVSAVPISHGLLQSLANYPNLAGIKDSSNDADGYSKFVKAFPNLNMMSGTVPNLKTALQASMGAILEANLFTSKAAAVFAAYRQGKDLDQPLEQLRQARPLLQAIGLNAYGPMKYALSLVMGTRQSYPRPPHVDVTEEQKTRIKTRLSELKQLS